MESAAHLLGNGHEAVGKYTEQDRVDFFSIDLLLLTVAFADVDHDVRLDEQCRRTGGDDNCLSAVGDDGRPFDPIAHFKILELVDCSILSPAFEVNLAGSGHLLVLAQVFRLDLLQLLVDGLLETFECLADPSSPDIIHYDVAVWEREPKLLLVLLDERFTERPVVAVVLLFGLFLGRFNDHKRGLGSTIP